MFAAAFKHACGLMRWPLACRGAATASSQLMAKWRHLLSLPGEDGGALPASQLRALLADALAVRIERGEAGIALPDEVSEVFMAAYDRIASGGIASRQQQLAFFTLIAREFGVQGEQRHTQHCTTLLHSPMRHPAQWQCACHNLPQDVL
jgi:hypothetical protein